MGEAGVGGLRLNIGVRKQSGVQQIVSQELNSQTTLGAHLDLAEEYFDRSRLDGVKGTIETPAWLVDEIIEIAFEALSPSQRVSDNYLQVRWLDPCCGAGAFVLGVIRKYLAEAGPQAEIADLPLISAIDVMPEALNATCVGVEELLNRHNLSLNDYLNSGRLVLEMNDFLNIARDNPTLLDSMHHDFDIVIGNPPYVRSRDWSPEQRSIVREAFPQLYRGGCDLYGYFYVAALNVTRAGGVVCFVTPFSFMRVSSAREVRTRLYDNSRLRSVLDLGEVGVFDGVALHAGVFTFRRESGDRRAAWGLLRDVSNRDSCGSSDIHWRDGTISPNSVGGWSFSGTSSGPKTLGRTLKSMSEHGIRVYSGIRPGMAEAFLLSEDQRSEFQHPRSIACIRPVITGREIQPWQTKRHKFWIIDSRSDGGDVGEEVMEHLARFRESLELRAEVTSTAQWHQLRSCTYMTQMEQEKIAFPDISKRQRFSLLPPEMLVLDGAFFLNTNRPALLGILNSAFARSFFEANCPAIGTPERGGRLRYKKSVLSKFPLPPLWPEGSSALARLDEVVSEVIAVGESCHEADALIERLVAKAYEGG